MSLRFRLAVFYSALLVAVLAVAGVVLHVGLERSLLAGMDTGLQDALALARPLVQLEDGKPTLTQEGELAPRLPPDLSLVLLDVQGRPLQILGRRPPTVRSGGAGCISARGWRFCEMPVPSGVLVATKSLRSLENSVASLDRVLWLLFPVMVPVAFVLGYGLSGRALAPLDRMTKEAYALAHRRALDRQLPEPRTRDEVWRLARATNALLAALAEVIENERRFTQNAAHELRTPLTVLRGRLERVLETGRIDQVREALAATESLLGLVEKLMALARAEAGQGLRSEPVMLDEVVVSICDELRPLFEAKGLKLVVHVPEAGVTIRGDDTALRMVVRNLVDNSCKFTDRGEVRVSLTGGAAEGGRPGSSAGNGQRAGGGGKATGSAQIVVEDSGPGIDPEALPHVFERFYRAQAGPRKPGSGLGLALVWALARWHGGDVQVENRPDGGARFTVRLPLS